MTCPRCEEPLEAGILSCSCVNKQHEKDVYGERTIRKCHNCNNILLIWGCICVSERFAECFCVVCQTTSVFDTEREE